MMKGMGKDITSGLVFILGVAIAATAAEMGVPIVAVIGALISLGAGLYEAFRTRGKRLRIG